MKIKSASVAGKFYSDDKKELLSQINFFEKACRNDYPNTTRAVIVPHAGYVYSGKVAYEGIKYLDKKIKNVFIIAPPHYISVKTIALSGYEAWETTLGEIELNKEIICELIENFGCEINDFAFEDEHSVEVQVPFVQTHLPNIKIIPILAGDKDMVEKIISNYWNDKENGFIISSDLSHFHTFNEAEKIDSLTAEMIEANDVEKFDYSQACGAVGICALANFAKSKNYSLIRINMLNSGDVTAEKSRVVGYGSWMLFEGEKNKFIKEYFSKFVIDTCKKSIMAKFENKIPDFKKIPAVFEENGACFVTLEKDDDLRGCIGSVIAHRALIDDLINNAQSSAFSDARFQPLKVDEFDDLCINVSLLSSPEKMSFEDEEDLLNEIRPNIDGIIIKDGIYQAVYLPSVWEQIPDKVDFLKSLKIKAGMPPNHFSATFEAYRYTTEYISDKD